MDTYSVHIEYRGSDPAAVSDAAIDAFLDALAEYGASVTGGEGFSSYSATVSILARSAHRAAEVAQVTISTAAAEAGLPEWPEVRIEATRDDVLAEDLAHPTLPELVSAPEVGEMLGVSSTRVHTLANENPNFPEPAYRLRSGKIWFKAAIEQFDAEWERKPGRPRKTGPLTMTFPRAKWPHSVVVDVEPSGARGWWYLHVPGVGRTETDNLDSAAEQVMAFVRKVHGDQVDPERITFEPSLDELRKWLPWLSASESVESGS